MLTWRSNRDDTLRAAYLGRCRVGYVARSAGWGDWFFHTSLLRPEGNCYVGRAATAELAVREMEEAVRAWISAAGLQEDGRRGGPRQPHLEGESE